MTVHRCRFDERVDGLGLAFEECLLAPLADAVGVITTHIHSVCRLLLGRCALAVLHAHIVLAARRELAYTTMSVKQVGLGPGFDHAGHFKRRFRRGTGHTPSVWRATAQRAGSSARGDAKARDTPRR